MTQLRRATSAQAVSRLATAAASPTSIKGRDTSWRRRWLQSGWGGPRDNTDWNTATGRNAKSEFYTTNSAENDEESCRTSFARQNSASQNSASHNSAERVLQNDDEEILQNEFCMTKFCKTNSAENEPKTRISFGILFKNLRSKTHCRIWMVTLAISDWIGRKSSGSWIFSP